MNTEDVTTLLKQGGILYEQERYEDALVLLEQVIALAPFDIEAYNAKGITLSQLERYKEAIDTFEKAIALAPDDAIAYGNKALALQRIGCSANASAQREIYKDGLAVCKQAIKRNPDLVSMYALKGFFLSILERYQEALRAYDQAIARDPQFLYAWHHKADVLFQLGQFKEAEQIYKRAYKLFYQSQHDNAIKEKLPASPVVLEQKLLTLGGQRMVYRYEPDLAAILSRGELFDDAAELVPGESRDCHGNAARLWSEQRKALAIVTGYALSEDDLWRQHSWLLRKHPTAEQCRLIETTIKREKYFGFVLTDGEAELFQENY